MSTNTEYKTVANHNELYAFSKYASPSVKREELVSECRKYGVNPNALLSFSENEDYTLIADCLKEKLKEKKQEIADDIQTQIDMRAAEIAQKEEEINYYKTITAKYKNTMESLHTKFANICQKYNDNFSNLSIDDRKIYNDYTSAKKLWRAASNIIYLCCQSLISAILNLGKWKNLGILSKG